MIGEALRWQRAGPPAGRWCAATSSRGRSGSSPGPIVGELLAAIAEEAFAGELRSAEEAIAFAAARIA